MDEMIAGARVDVAPYKRSPADFVLWKPSSDAQPGWDSPWGRGRPGWHIECSAMIETHLGQTIDIHGGGIDLEFPHHENEIAQSSCAHEGAPLARYWLHNGMLSMAASKMSKSLGNVVSVGELLEQGHKGEVLRLALLTAHYRQPLEWSPQLIAQSKATLDRLYRVADDSAPGTEDPPTPGFAARAMWRSRPVSAPAPRPSSAATSPKPTGSAPSWPRRGSCSRTRPPARRGGEA